MPPRPTTYVVTVAPGRPPVFHLLAAGGAAPVPVPAERLPPGVRGRGLALQAWASGLPPPPGAPALRPALLGRLPRAFPLAVALVVPGGAPPATLH